MEGNELNMNLFSAEPSIDLTGDENIDYLFGGDDPAAEELDETITNEDEETGDKPVDNPESVVGEDTDDDPEEGDPLDDESDEADEESSSNPNLFNSLAALLQEKGLISSDESDLNVETEDAFVDLFKKQIKTSEYSDLNDYQKEYLDKLRDGIPHQKVEKDIYESNQLDSITEDVINEDSDLRHRIIYQDLINKGFTDTRARKTLQRSIELEQDAEDALDALTSIKAHTALKIETENNKIKQDAADNQAAEAKRIESLKTRIRTSDEVIKDFKITDSVKKKVEDNMFKVIGKNPDTNESENSLIKYRRENTEEFDYKLYYLYTITDGFKNFDSLIKNTNSTVLKDLEKAVKSTTKIKDPGSPAYLQDPESYSIGIAGHEIVVE